MLHIYYGKGKGKTSAALGLALRAAGYKKRIIFFQFLKPKNFKSGEHLSLKKLKTIQQIRFNQRHPIFAKKNCSCSLQNLKKEINASLEKLRDILKKKNFDILICDELLNCIHKNVLDETTLIQLFKPIKNEKEVILTGRKKPQGLFVIADYITECRCLKHPFDKGILARKAIEF